MVVKPRSNTLLSRPNAANNKSLVAHAHSANGSPSKVGGRMILPPPSPTPLDRSAAGPSRVPSVRQKVSSPGSPARRRYGDNSQQQQLRRSNSASSDAPSRRPAPAAADVFSDGQERRVAKSAVDPSLSNYRPHMYSQPLPSSAAISPVKAPTQARTSPGGGYVPDEFRKALHVRRRSSIRYKSSSTSTSTSAPPEPVEPERSSAPADGYPRRRSSIRYIKDNAADDSADISRPSIGSPNFTADNKAKFLADYMRQNPDVEALAEKEKTAMEIAPKKLFEVDLPAEDEDPRSEDGVEEREPERTLTQISSATRNERPSQARGASNSSIDTLTFSPTSASSELGLQLQLSNSTAASSSRPSSLGLGDVHTRGVMPDSSVRGSVCTVVSDVSSRPRSVHWPDSDCPSSDGELCHSYDEIIPSERTKTIIASTPFNNAQRSTRINDARRRLGISTARPLASGQDDKLFAWLASPSDDGSPANNREAVLARTMNALTRNAAPTYRHSNEDDLVDVTAAETTLAVDEDGQATSYAYKSASSRTYKTPRPPHQPAAAWAAPEPPSTADQEIVASAYQGSADEGLGQGFGYGEGEAPVRPLGRRVQVTTPSMASSGGEGDEPARPPRYDLELNRNSQQQPVLARQLFLGTLIPSTNSSRILGQEKDKASLRLLATFSARSAEAPASSSHRLSTTGYHHDYRRMSGVLLRTGMTGLNNLASLATTLRWA